MHYGLVAELHDCSFDREPAKQTQLVDGTCRPERRSPAGEWLPVSHRLVCSIDAAGDRWVLPRKGLELLLYWQR